MLAKTTESTVQYRRCHHRQSRKSQSRPRLPFCSNVQPSAPFYAVLQWRPSRKAPLPCSGCNASRSPHPERARQKLVKLCGRPYLLLRCFQGAEGYLQKTCTILDSFCRSWANIVEITWRDQHEGLPRSIAPPLRRYGIPVRTCSMHPSMGEHRSTAQLASLALPAPLADLMLLMESPSSALHHSHPFDRPYVSCPICRRRDPSPDHASTARTRVARFARKRRRIASIASIATQSTHAPRPAALAAPSRFDATHIHPLDAFVGDQLLLPPASASDERSTRATDP